MGYFFIFLKVGENMKGYYTSYKCRICRKEIILITEELEKTLAAGKDISCSHCGCKNLVKEKVTEDLRECMDHASYKKVRGAIRQVR